MEDDHHALEHQLAHLADSERPTATTYDPRAHGPSTMTGGHNYEQHGRDLHAFIEASVYERSPWWPGRSEALTPWPIFASWASTSSLGLMMLGSTPKGRGAGFATEWVWFGGKEQGDQDDIYKLFAYNVLVTAKSR